MKRFLTNHDETLNHRYRYQIEAVIEHCGGGDDWCDPYRDVEISRVHMSHMMTFFTETYDIREAYFNEVYRIGSHTIRVYICMSHTWRRNYIARLGPFIFHKVDFTGRHFHKRSLSFAENIAKFMDKYNELYD